MLLKTNNKFKKVLSLFLAFVVIIGTLSVSAFALTDEERKEKLSKIIENTFEKRLLFCTQSYIIKRLSTLAEVVEWQTRRTQNPLVAIPCGFKSHHRHQTRCAIPLCILFLFMEVFL